MSTEPWLVLRRAADRLEELATRAPCGPWVAGERCVWHADGGDEAIIADGDQGDGGCIDEATASWVATLSPAVAEPLVAWLRYESTMARLRHFDEDHKEPEKPHAQHALALARAVLGEQVETT